MAALGVSKLPVAEASAVIERLTGVKLSRATLDREARRQGKKAEKKRQELDEQMSQGAGADQQVKELRLNKPAEPFTLVIELDAWNIRERGGRLGPSGGQARLRAKSRSGGTGFMGAPVFD